MSERRGPSGPRARGSLVGWLLEQDLLRGPFVFTDYWASVLQFSQCRAETMEEAGLIDRVLFRLGLDRPDLELPRIRYYILLFLIGPFVFPLHAFRRMGKYRIRFRSEVGDDVWEALKAYRLTLAPAGGAPGDTTADRADTGRVDVSSGDEKLATDVIDPYLISGFSSLFYAAYKLPFAALIAALVTILLVVAFNVVTALEPLADELLVAAPILVLVLYLIFRDWSTSILGSLPALLVVYLVGIVRMDPVHDWMQILLALAGLLAVFLIIDWFFLPRPVPPVLMLYTKSGPGQAYEREGNAPHWLDGDIYWVWRYLMLTPAELNKFWERDWERVELWIRADGEEAGMLEWVVADGHYRELWYPTGELGSPASVVRLRQEARKCRDEREPGFWLLEVDADPVVHTPFFRVVSFLPEGEGIPVHGVGHLARSLFSHVRRHDPEPYRKRLDRLRLTHGVDVLEDVPELVAHLTARYLLSQPWRYWRYPLGANRRREARLYDAVSSAGSQLAADPELQIKQEEH
ncbi:MAG: hypothetical protein ABFS14_11370 [Gemmatimonadota bacterium]